MGFSQQNAVAALTANGGVVERAAAWLMDGNTAAAPAPAVAPAPMPAAVPYTAPVLASSEVHQARGQGVGDAISALSEQARKRHFLSHLYTKCIILPRQARDKHRENSKKCRFLAALCAVGGGGRRSVCCRWHGWHSSARHRRRWREGAQATDFCGEEKRVFCAILY
jgi:hypothetical protein